MQKRGFRKQMCAEAERHPSAGPRVRQHRQMISWSLPPTGTGQLATGLATVVLMQAYPGEQCPHQVPPPSQSCNIWPGSERRDQSSKQMTTSEQIACKDTHCAGLTQEIQVKAALQSLK